MCFDQFQQVPLQRRRLTRYVQNMLKIRARAKRRRIESGARRIDEHGVEVSELRRRSKVSRPKRFAIKSDYLSPTRVSILQKITLRHFAQFAIDFDSNDAIEEWSESDGMIATTAV